MLIKFQENEKNIASAYSAANKLYRFYVISVGTDILFSYRHSQIKEKQ